MDIIDAAQTEVDRQLAYALARRPHKEVFTCHGYCHNCAEPVAADLRYCDGDCRDDHQARQRALSQRP